MSTWYVRPDTSHNVTRNGTAYSTAWGGWSEVVWGGAGIIAGDTLYICGAHTYGVITAIGAHGATVSSRVTIRGDYATSPGIITYTAGAFYFNINRSYTTLTNITVDAGDNRCVVLTGQPLTGAWVTNCTLIGAASPCIELLSVNLWSYIDTVIDGNTFSGTGGSGGSAVHWSPGTTVTVSLAGIQITNNTFTGCSSTRGVIVLKPIGTSGTPAQVGTKMTDVDIHNNTFTNCAGVAVETYGPEVYGRNTGIKIYNNTIRNQGLGSTGLGGAFVPGGFGPSLTASFGPNVIHHNNAYIIAGPSGFCNPMYGSYIIYDNYAEDISTGSIDGCGILFDHGADGCTAYGNTFKRITGTGIADYISGAGIGVIYDATNITVYGNVIDGCVMGIWYANQTSGRVSNIFNNHFLNCSLVGMDGNNTTFGADPNLARNNLLTALNSSVPAINYTSGAWSGESKNCFYGFAVGTQAINATSITTNPLLASDLRPKAGSPLIAAGVYIQNSRGTGHKTFQNPPSIGAFEYVRPRTARV